MNRKEIPQGIKITEEANPMQIKSLLESFWGKNSDISNYSQEQVSFSEALTILESVISIPEPDGKKTVQSKLNGKRISLMASDPTTSELIAHSSLLVFADTVEASGSIIKDSYRGKVS